VDPSRSGVHEEHPVHVEDGRVLEELAAGGPVGDARRFGPALELGDIPTPPPAHERVGADEELAWLSIHDHLAGGGHLGGEEPISRPVEQAERGPLAGTPHAAVSGQTPPDPPLDESGSQEETEGESSPRQKEFPPVHRR
jgi:hypothetical protein